MRILLDREGTIDGLAPMLKALQDDDGVFGIMILACDDNAFTPETVDGLLTQCTKPIWGGIFPGILYELEKLERGTILAGITHPVQTKILRQISVADLDGPISQIEQHGFGRSTMFVYVDSLSTGIERVKEALFDHIGLIPNYIGGGAGSLSFVQKPCVFTEQGLLADAAVLALVQIRSGVGVAHGWHPVSKPLKITEVDRNRIISINWQPAFDVYRQIVEKLSGEYFSGRDFFQLSKRYPLGIVKLAKEMVVRDPIEIRNEKEIICVGEIPVNSFVYILNGDMPSLIQGAKDAKQRAEESYDEGQENTTSHAFATLFIDCISRVLFLQEDFHNELKVVKTDLPLMGALTLGEIANTGKFYLEFYNKTSVVALLEG